MKTVAIIQARLGSSRLPGKVLYELAGRPMIVLMTERVKRCPGLDEVVLATGDGAENDALADIAGSLDIAIFRGPEDDVLERIAGAAREAKADVIVRLTGDCPLIDPEVVALVLQRRAAEGLDYCTNVHPPSWPDGLDCSAFTMDTLARAEREAVLPSEREHVVPWMWKQSSLEGSAALSAANLPCPQDRSNCRWTVDTAGDYLMMRALCDEIGAERIVETGWREIAEILDANPQIAALNAGEVRDTGLAESRARDASQTNRAGANRG